MENWQCSYSAKPVPTGSNIRQRLDQAGYSRSGQCNCSPVPGAPRKFRVRSAQVRAKRRNRRQAILSESAQTQFVYARSMRAVSMLCSLRPLLASSIITKPDLLPVGFAGLRHSAGGFLPSAFFLSRVCTLPILRRRDCAMEQSWTEPEGCSAIGSRPQFQVNFFKPQFNGPLLSPRLTSWYPLSRVIGTP